MNDHAGPEPVWASGALAGLRWIEGRPLAWLVRLDDPMARDDARAAALTSQETEAFSRTPDAPWRMLRFRLAKALIAQVAACHPDLVQIERDPLGALHVVAPVGWYISLAGQAPLALIGLHRAAVGVDIEPWAAAPPPPHAFSSNELKMLDNLWDDASDRARLSGWVAKEAHGKACGRARKLDPRDIELRKDLGPMSGASVGFSTRIHFAIDTATIAAVAVLVAPHRAPRLA